MFLPFLLPGDVLVAPLTRLPSTSSSSEVAKVLSLGAGKVGGPEAMASRKPWIQRIKLKVCHF